MDRISDYFYTNALSSLAGFVGVVGLISSVIQYCTDTRSWKDWICQGFRHLLLLTKVPEEVQKEQNTLDANSEQWKYRRTKKGKKEEEKKERKKSSRCDVCTADLFSSDNTTCTFWNTFFVDFCSLLVVSGRHVIHCIYFNAEFEENVSV